jgi:hypothetical protein
VLAFVILVFLCRVWRSKLVHNKHQQDPPHCPLLVLKWRHRTKAERLPWQDSCIKVILHLIFTCELWSAYHDATSGWKMEPCWSKHPSLFNCWIGIFFWKDILKEVIPWSYPLKISLCRSCVCFLPKLCPSFPLLCMWLKWGSVESRCTRACCTSVAKSKIGSMEIILHKSLIINHARGVQVLPS